MTCEAASKQKIKYPSVFQVYDLIDPVFSGTEIQKSRRVKIGGVKKLESNKAQKHKFLPAESITYCK